ncbi:MAG TPA: SH3 domain-containing protein [Planctomycetota bacterium]|nr:SH3 domain-containing protein [Planctomycetota bacterium]
MSADFDAALQLYRDQHYGEAAAAFADLARDEPDASRAAVLHADAGTAAARAESWGEAVWHLRKARLLEPRDAVAAVNLARVRAVLGEGSSEAAHFTETLRELPLHLTLAESDALCGVAVSLALLLLAARRLLPAPRVLVAVAVGLLVLAAGWWPASLKAWNAARARAVIIPPTAVGHAEPDAGSEVLFRLGAGTLVRAEEERRGWRLVESDAGARGWVPEDDARPLR